MPLARVLVTLGRAAEVLAWLTPWEEKTRATGQVSILIDLLALKALALADKTQAQAALVATLTKPHWPTAGRLSGHSPTYCVVGTHRPACLSCWR